MYAMRVSEAGTLEHLYWGAALPPEVDLRYTTRSNVAQPFDPTISRKEALRMPCEAPENPLLVQVDAEASVHGKSLFDVWKAHRGAPDHENRMEGHKSRQGGTFERRLENITWRLLGMDKLGDERIEGAATALLAQEGLVAQSAGSSHWTMPRSSAQRAVLGANMRDSIGTSSNLDFLLAAEPPRLDRLQPTHKNASRELDEKKWRPFARASLSEAGTSRSSAASRSLSLALDLPLSDRKLLALAQARTRSLGWRTDRPFSRPFRPRHAFPPRGNSRNLVSLSRLCRSAPTSSIRARRSSLARAAARALAKAPFRIAALGSPL